MSSELKPCPACGGEGLYYCGTSGAFYIPCTECTFVGQPGIAPNEAARLWNALPRELEWSSAPPKVPGWYWHTSKKYPQEKSIMRVTESYMDVLDENNRELWAGPIHEPKGGAE